MNAFSLSLPIGLTAFQIVWAYLWAKKHVEIRRSRAYATKRTQTNTNRLYQLLSPVMYMGQNVLCITSFWSDAAWLFKFHDSDALRICGVMTMSLSIWLYFWAIRHLGQNYSPCYDSHLPLQLIEDGPYRIIRHPMYLGKILLGIGTVVISGSFWFIIPSIYLIVVTSQSMLQEELVLKSHLRGFADYQTRTARLIPGVF